MTKEPSIQELDFLLEGLNIPNWETKWQENVKAVREAENEAGSTRAKLLRCQDFYLGATQRCVFPSHHLDLSKGNTIEAVRTFLRNVIFTYERTNLLNAKESKGNLERLHASAKETLEGIRTLQDAERSKVASCLHEALGDAYLGIEFVEWFTAWEKATGEAIPEWTSHRPGKPRGVAKLKDAEDPSFQFVLSLAVLWNRFVGVPTIGAPNVPAKGLSPEERGSAFFSWLEQVKLLVDHQASVSGLYNRHGRAAVKFLRAELAKGATGEDLKKLSPKSPGRSPGQAKKNRPKG